MMKKFLLIVCGSFVGTTLALLVFMLMSIVFSIAMMSIGGSMGKASASVQKNSILHLKLEGEIAVDVLPGMLLHIAFETLDALGQGAQERGFLLADDFADEFFL